MMWRVNNSHLLVLASLSPHTQLRITSITCNGNILVPIRTKIVGSSTISYKEHLVQRTRDYKSPPRYVIKAWTRVERGYRENRQLRLDGFIPAILMRPSVAPFSKADLIPFYVQRLQLEWMKKWRSTWVSSVLHEIRVLQAVVEREVAIENAMLLIPADTSSSTTTPRKTIKHRFIHEFTERPSRLLTEKEVIDKLKAHNIPLPLSLQQTAPWRTYENDPLFQQLIQAKDPSGAPMRYGFEALWRKVKYIQEKLLPEPPCDYETLMRDLGRTEPPSLDDMAHWFPTPSPQRPPLLLKLRPGPIRAHQVQRHFLGRRYWLDVVDLNERYQVVPQQMSVDIFHFHPRSIVFRLWDPRSLPRHRDPFTQKYDPIEYFASIPPLTSEETALIDECERIVDVWKDMNPFGTEFDDPAEKQYGFQRMKMEEEEEEAEAEKEKEEEKEKEDQKKGKKEKGKKEEEKEKGKGAKEKEKPTKTEKGKEEAKKDDKKKK